jgi:MFS family permease
MATQTEVELDTIPVLQAPKTSPPSLTLPEDLTPALAPAAPTTVLPKGRSIIVITQLAGINFLTSFTNGIVTVGLPAIAADIGLKNSLIVWPTSVLALTSGTCLLLAGAVADVVGPRGINLAGCFLLAIFILACGVSQTGVQLIIFRALQGIGSALAVPTGISIVSTTIADGRPRNLGFACLGLSQPLGFSLGLVLGGILIKTIGWRSGFYIGGGLSFLLFVVGIWALPLVAVHRSEAPKLKRLATDIDWVGAGLASTSIAIFSYVLA